MTKREDELDGIFSILWKGGVSTQAFKPAPRPVDWSFEQLVKEWCVEVEP